MKIDGEWPASLSSTQTACDTRQENRQNFILLLSWEPSCLPPACRAHGSCLPDFPTCLPAGWAPLAQERLHLSDFVRTADTMTVRFTVSRLTGTTRLNPWGRSCLPPPCRAHVSCLPDSLSCLPAGWAPLAQERLHLRGCSKHRARKLRQHDSATCMTESIPCCSSSVLVVQRRWLQLRSSSVDLIAATGGESPRGDTLHTARTRCLLRPQH